MKDEDDDIGSDFDDFRDRTKWAILIDLKQESSWNGWMITRVNPGTELGEREIDLCNDKHDYMVAAFFDEATEAFINAAIEFGGNSLEVREKVTEVLSGVCRSFVEAQRDIADLERESATQDPDPS